MKLSDALTIKYASQIIHREETFTDDNGVVRTAKVTDLSNLSQRDTYEMYSNIGHEDDPQNILWLMRGNKILTTPAGENVYHHTQWELLPDDYRGRLTKDKSGSLICTMFKPMNSSPDKDSQVIRKLMVEFSPSDIQVFG